MRRSRFSFPPASRTLFWLLVAAAAAVMLLFNCLTPFVADDFTFAFNYRTGERLTGLWDVLQSQTWHYMTWSGRFLIKSLDQWFTIQPKLLFNLCNTLVYVGLALVVYLAAKGRRAPADPQLLLFIFLSFWMVSPVFGQTNLWMCGSFNYLWASFFCLAAGLPFTLQLHSPLRRRPWLAPACFVAGLVGGWSSENTSAGLLVLMVLALFWQLFRERKAPLWMFTGLSGGLLGFALLILAPGNYQRQDAAPDPRGPVTILATRFLTALNMLWDHGLPLLVIFAVLFWLLWLQKPAPQVLFLPLALLAAGLGANFAMILSPVYYDRSTHGVFVFLTAACAAALAGLDRSRLHGVLGGAAAGLALVACFQLLWASYDIASFWMMHRTREAELLSLKQQGQTQVVSYSIECYTRWCSGYGLPDLRTDPEDWVCADMAHYYGLESLSANEARTYPFPGRTNNALETGLPEES